MKKILIILICLCILCGSMSVCAVAEEPVGADLPKTPEIAAIYAAADEDTDGESGLSTIIRYVFEDGTYEQYRVQNERCEIDSRGQTDAHEEQGIGFTQIYPRIEEITSLPAMNSGESASAPVIDNSEYIDEGTGTGIRIIGYTKFGGTPDDYFPAAGDKIAVISPSALPSREQTEATMEGIRSWGFEPVQGRHVYSEVRTLEECMEDFRWALEDPEIKAIFCVRGGYGATELMDAVTEDRIASAGKPIIGFSDITACHGAWTRAGLPSIHGSMSSAFQEFPEECAQAEQNMIAGELPIYECEADAYCREGTAEGILIGGNLSTFAATFDTAYDSTKLNKPYILFLEEVGENMQHIHRYLTILKHKGILDDAAGIVFGKWMELPSNGMGNYGDARGGLFASVADMITRQFLDDIEVPVAFGFPAGHGEVNYPLLMGATAKLEVSGNHYTLSWPEAAGE